MEKNKQQIVAKHDQRWSQELDEFQHDFDEHFEGLQKLAAILDGSPEEFAAHCMAEPAIASLAKTYAMRHLAALTAGLAERALTEGEA